ncbi:S-layer homology domain-containing protein [Paenibacillus sp. YYML68]|uniref:S-layer homology domain-containing protein n=1 Tax=Paenibacillus sp. YYML68 TaxID=2909250 RepID=UPI002491CED0|nr:S-layer homology domain-containing protein [Paenibacillus sp. YYML68]
MKNKWLQTVAAAVILTLPVSGIVWPLPTAQATALSTITVQTSANVTAGQAIVIKGTATLPTVLVKVINNTNDLVEYFDSVAVQNGEYQTSFHLRSGAPVGSYTVVVGQGTTVQTAGFQYVAQQTGGGGPTGPTGSTPPPPPPTPVTPPATPVTTGKVATYQAPKDATVVTPVTENGKQVLKAVVDNKKLQDYIATIAKTSAANQPKPVVVIDVPGKGDQVQATLQIGTFQTLQQQSEQASLQIKTELGALSIPTKSISSKAQEIGLTSETPVQIKVTKADASSTTLVESMLGTGNTIVSPVEFTIEVTSTGTTTEMNGFDAYLEHTVYMPSVPQADYKYMTGVYVDPLTNSYYPMPTMFNVSGSGQLDGTILRKGNSIYTVVKNKKQFTDMSGSYASDVVETLASKYFLNGFEDGTFRPEKSVTRAEFITMLTRSLGLVPDKSGAVGFTDVQPDQWFAGAVSIAVKEKLVNGYEDNTFRPEQRISRQEMVQLMYNAMKSAGYSSSLTKEASSELLKRFSDQGDVPAWAQEAAAAAIQEKIVSGMDNDRFAPGETADRAQSATILYRMMKALNFIN